MIIETIISLLIAAHTADAVPAIKTTWYVECSPLTSAQNMGELYAAIDDYLSRDECGCQKGDPLCDCEYNYTATVTSPSE
jgi:hypothetical protein